MSEGEVKKKAVAEKMAQEDGEATDVRSIPDEVEDEIRLAEIERGYRIVENTPWGRIRIYDISFPKVARRADEAYARTYGRLVKDSDYMTQKQMLRLLDERGIWTKEDEARLESIAREIQEKGKAARALAGKDREEAKKEIQELAQRYWDLVIERQRHLGATIETLAETDRRMAAIVAAVRRDTGSEDDGYEACEPVWGSVDELESEPPDRFLFIQAECHRFWNNAGLGEDFFGAWLEEAIFRSAGNTARTPADHSSEETPDSG